MSIYETRIDEALEKGPDTCRFFAVSDLSKVNVNIVLNLKRQVLRRRNYTCGHRDIDLKTKNAYCTEWSGPLGEKVRCIDVPLNKCPFVPESTITGKELKPRFTE